MRHTSARLFRREALAALDRPRYGAAIGGNARTGIAAVALLLLPTVGILALAFHGTYQPRMTVTGRIVAGAGAVDVAADRRGVVSRILIAAGDRVGRGEPLLALGTVSAAADRHPIALAKRKMIDREIMALGNKREILAERSRHRRGRTAEAIRSTERELEILDRLVADAAQRVELLATSHRRARELHRGGQLSAAATDDARLQFLEARIRHRDFERERVRLRERLSGQRLEAAADGNRFREEELEIEAREAQLERLMLDLGAENESFMLSPADGHVGVLLVREGSSVDVGQPVVSVVPANTTASAELSVPSSVVTLISPGQSVRLRYDSLPVRRYGTFSGRITSIGATPVARAPKLGPLFRVRVELDHPWPQRNGKTLRAYPGSTLEADILDAERAIWRRLVEPLRELGLTG